MRPLKLVPLMFLALVACAKPQDNPQAKTQNELTASEASIVKKVGKLYGIDSLTPVLGLNSQPVSCQADGSILIDKEWLYSVSSIDTAFEHVVMSSVADCVLGATGSK